MAEIKSTMDLVMERASRMGKASSDELEAENVKKQGMKLAAEFLDQKSDQLMEPLSGFAADQQMTVRKGMVEVLLRNIFLPKDEAAIERTARAAKGLVELGGGAGDLSAICAEIQNVLGQYHQHREQLKTQLEEQVKQQYEQLMAQQQSGMGTEGGSPEMALQARIKEEWTRLEGELVAQYNQAIEQHKKTLKERLS
jgi:hypothetical protein